MMWTLLGIFAGGMALNLTPCVYPLIPVTISYFGSKSDKRQLIGHGLCYIGGLAITNSVLGVVAALTGGLMGAILQNALVLVLVAMILILMATSLFGLWELRLPTEVMQAASKTYAGYIGTLHRPLCSWAFDLGGRHGQPLAGVCGLFHPEPGPRTALIPSGYFLRKYQPTSPIRRMDAVGPQTDGVGPGWKGFPQLFF